MGNWEITPITEKMLKIYAIEKGEMKHIGYVRLSCIGGLQLETNGLHTQGLYAYTTYGTEVLLKHNATEEDLEEACNWFGNVVRK